MSSRAEAATGATARPTLLAAVHSGAMGGAQAMGLAEAERFADRARIVAAVPEGPLRARFGEIGELVEETPSLPTWPTTPQHWSWRLARSAADAPRLAREIRRHRVDAVITSSAVLMTPVMAARLARVPVFVHVREWPVTRLGLTVLAMHRRLADVVVAISAGGAERMEGPGRARIVRIPDGISAPTGGPQPARLGSPLRLCVIGALTGGDGKGQHRAVEALALLRERGVEATLSVVGPVLDEAYGERVRATARRLGVEGAVEMAGVSDDVPGLLRAHDLLLFCSRQGADVTPLTIMEALVEARPVVAAGVGSVGEVLGDGRFGTVVAPEDPAALAAGVEAVLADPEAARARALAGRGHVAREFNREAGMEALWTEVLAEIEARRR